MNRGTDTILSAYSDARTEYSKQLSIYLVPAYFKFFIDLLERAKEVTVNEPKKSLWQFQNYLNEIHDWNMEKVNNEIHNIYNNCGCDYLEELLTAVFIAHTKVLTAIRISPNNKKIEINIPKIEHFLFKVLCETSKLLWSSTYLFRDNVPGIEKQQNYRNIENILNEGIIQAVRSLVPVKSILKDLVNNDTTDDEEDDDTDNIDKKSQPSKVSILKSSQNIPNDIPQSSDNDIGQLHNSLDNINLDDNSISSQPIETNIHETVKEEVKQEEVKQEEVKQEKIKQEEVKQEEVKQEEVKQEEVPQTIIIDDKPTVRFGQFDAVFDLDQPNNSDMVFDPKEDDHIPELEILDENGIPLSEGIDFDDLNNESEIISSDDYEEL